MADCKIVIGGGQNAASRKFKYLIVVLVYKNIDVLKEFFHKINLPNSHVVVVNSFYDEKSKEECKVTIAD